MSGVATDGELARRIADAAEDSASCEAELCRRFLNRASSYGLKHLRFDVTAAEDLAQQVMAILLEALRAGRVEDPDRVDRFMLGTCRNVAHTMRRGERRADETKRRLSSELAGASSPPWDLVESRRVEEYTGGSGSSEPSAPGWPCLLFTAEPLLTSSFWTSLSGLLFPGPPAHRPHPSRQLTNGNAPAAKPPSALDRQA
jgi:hypothetical protein